LRNKFDEPHQTPIFLHLLPVEEAPIYLLNNICVFYLNINENVGSGKLRQMSEYAIPHGEHYHSYILRERYRSATGLISKMLSRLFPHPQ
jgi:hypothetical protein